MSLLIKALKQAERAHRAQAPSAVASAPAEIPLALDEAAIEPRESPPRIPREAHFPQSLDEVSAHVPYDETPAPTRHAPLELAREDEVRQPGDTPAPPASAESNPLATARTTEPPNPSRWLLRSTVVFALLAATVAVGVWLYLQTLPESMPGYGPESTVAAEIFTPGRGSAVIDANGLVGSRTSVGESAGATGEGQREGASSPTGGSVTSDSPGRATADNSPMGAAKASPAATANPSPRPIAQRDAPATAVAPPQAAAPVPRAAAVTRENSQPQPLQAPVRFVRDGVTQTRKQATIAAAWQALRDGSLDLSERLYREVLTLDPNQIDAWVGLASIASRRGDTGSAQQHYENALRIDPNDSVAKSGLLQLRGGASVDQESALRSAMASGRGGAATHFALGHVLAAQGRWADAQQAWFDAYAADPGNPDYAFNLAVALERIRQPMPALEHYRKALAAARARPSRFDTAQAQARIEVLEARTAGGARR